MVSVIEEIKSRLDLADFLRGYLELRPAGKNFKALCPFHKEKTPSFMVSPDRQIWHCFGCGQGGDVFGFLMKHDNLEFYEALKVLAEKAGVELKAISPADQREFGVLYDLNQAAADFFKTSLGQSAAGREYLLSRGLRKETIENFSIGFAPNNFEDLTLRLINAGFDVKDAVRAGLTIRSEKGKYFDRFRGRIMFPLLNNFGKVIGFSGRILPQFEGGETAKYLNSPETPIFSKSRVVFGLYQAREAIRESGSIVLMEGQMDVVMSQQDGVKNAVATSGTALTPDHLRTLKRFSNNLVLCFDNDEAGKQAMERSIDLAHGSDFETRVLDLGRVSLKDKAVKDPAEAAQVEPGSLAKLIANAQSAMEYYLSRYLGEKDIARQKNNLRFVLGKIKKLASPVERHHWVREIAERENLRESDLLEEMEKLNEPEAFVKRKETEEEQGEPRKLSRRELVSERILAILSQKEEWRDRLSAVQDYLPPPYFTVYNCIVSGKRPDEEKLAAMLDLISLRSGLEEKDDRELGGEFDDLLRYLEIEFLIDKKNELQNLIKKSEKETGAGPREKIEEFQAVARRIEELRKKK
jgi:DNA primase